MSQTEESRLASIAAKSLYAERVNGAMIEYSFTVFRRFLRPGSLLELGPAEGLMTDKLAELNMPLTVVDGALEFCDGLRARFPSANIVQSLFEDFQPDRTFTNIIMGHVLEHVSDPIAILRKCKQWLGKEGRILAAVPNARSLHRQAGVIMGVLETENALNEADRHHGHRRVYDPESFRRDFLRAGLQIETFGGYWLKPVSNTQIAQNWTNEMLQAFMALGERYPDIAAEIYIVARAP